MNAKILIVEDEPQYQELYRLYLPPQKYILHTCDNCLEARQLVRSFQPQILLLDLRLKDGVENDSFTLIQEIKRTHPDIKIIVLTGHGSVANATRALQCGAFEFLEKDDNLQQVLALRVQNAWRSWQLERQVENFGLMGKNECGVDIVGSSELIKHIIQKLPILAQTQKNLLILGESGTGKSLIARAIHDLSARSAAPFVTINCHLPVNLVESELFGYKRGAFTDARQDKKGKFHMADAGTLFMDEIGLMPLEVQSRLLTVIGSDTSIRKITPLGAMQEDEVDVRIICATNVDLPEAVKSGLFREDLFHRIETLSLTLPPLRERRKDIPELVAHFHRRALREENREQPRYISDEAMQLLTAYDWPGNVRELQNVVERAVIFSKSNHILPMDLEDSLLPTVVGRKKTGLSDLRRELGSLEHDMGLIADGLKRETASWTLKDAEHEAKRRHLEQCFKHTNHDIEKACQLLEISRRHLNRLVREYGIAKI